MNSTESMDVGKSFLLAVEKEVFSNRSTTEVLVTSVVIFILGGLALAGVFYPTASVIGSLGGGFGLYGSGSLMGAGALLFVTTVIGRLVHYLLRNYNCVSKYEGGDRASNRPGGGGGYSIAGGGGKSKPKFTRDTDTGLAGTNSERTNVTVGGKEDDLPV